MRALAAGARAYLLKSATDEDLIPAVRAVAAGKPYFSPAVTAVLVEDYIRRLQQRGLDRLVSPADRSREGGAAAARRRAIEQGSRDPARSRTLDGGDASGEPDAEAEPAQHRRDRALCGPKGSDRLASPEGLALGLPDTRPRSPLRRLAPVAWLARDARSRCYLPAVYEIACSPPSTGWILRLRFGLYWFHDGWKNSSPVPRRHTGISPYSVWPQPAGRRCRGRRAAGLA